MEIEVKRIQSVEVEIKRLELAIQQSEQELEAIKAHTKKELGQDKAKIFSAHLLILQDPEFKAFLQEGKDVNYRDFIVKSPLNKSIDDELKKIYRGHNYDFVGKNRFKHNF